MSRGRILAELGRARYEELQREQEWQNQQPLETDERSRKGDGLATGTTQIYAFIGLFYLAGVRHQYVIKEL